MPTTMRGNPHYKSLWNGLSHMVVVCAYYHVRRYSFQGRTEGVRSHGGTIFRPPCESEVIYFFGVQKKSISLRGQNGIVDRPVNKSSSCVLVNVGDT